MKKNIFKQIFKFGIVGGLSFVTDYVLLYIFSKFMYYLVAAAISYAISTGVNYILSMAYVFESKGGSKLKEITIFAILSLIGLGLTEIGMFILTDVFKLYYMFSKVFVTALVMVFNFVTRKLFIEKHEV